jgi:ADP-heptose:LPS heptosyltransferase
LRSTSETAGRLLECLLGGEPWPRAWLRELIEQNSPALFSVVAEGLSDRFEPRLVEAYSEIFAEAIAAVLPEYLPADLVERYRRVHRLRRFEGEARTVFVLSRVTLGAEVAITSVILDAVKRRLPRARIVLAGPRKCWELFAADPRIEHLPVSYDGALRDRIAVSPPLAEPESIVVDPDSRITQLGLLPVCPEENYYLFDSRTYGGDGTDSLGALARRWVAETFGIADARSYIAPWQAEAPAPPGIAVSFGVGGNAAKRIADPFEARLLAALAERGLPLVVDAGAGGEEAGRVERAIAASGARVEVWRGSFAGFASIIARSRLYVGYDSAGQHVAAACGVPLVTVFAGASCRRFEQRWRPFGASPVEVIPAEGGDPEAALARVIEAVGRLTPKRPRDY